MLNHKLRYSILITALMLVIFIGFWIFSLKSIESTYPNENQSIEQIIENKTSIKLPVSAKVINYTIFDNNSGSAKISFANDDMELLRKEMNDYFGSDLGNDYTMLNFKNTSPWWDLKKGNVKNAYLKVIGEGDGTAASPSYTGFVWAFLSQDLKGEWFLYISL